MCSYDIVVIYLPTFYEIYFSSLKVYSHVYLLHITYIKHATKQVFIIVDSATSFRTDGEDKRASFGAAPDLTEEAPFHLRKIYIYSFHLQIVLVGKNLQLFNNLYLKYIFISHIKLKT